MRTDRYEYQFIAFGLFAHLARFIGQQLLPMIASREQKLTVFTCPRSCSATASLCDAWRLWVGRNRPAAQEAVIEIAAFDSGPAPHQCCGPRGRFQSEAAGQAAKGWVSAYGHRRHSLAESDRQHPVCSGLPGEHREGQFAPKAVVRLGGRSTLCPGRLGDHVGPAPAECQHSEHAPAESYFGL